MLAPGQYEPRTHPRHATAVVPPRLGLYDPGEQDNMVAVVDPPTVPLTPVEAAFGLGQKYPAGHGSLQLNEVWPRPSPRTPGGHGVGTLWPSPQ